MIDQDGLIARVLQVTLSFFFGQALPLLLQLMAPFRCQLVESLVYILCPVLLFRVHAVDAIEVTKQPVAVDCWHAFYLAGGTSQLSLPLTGQIVPVGLEVCQLPSFDFREFTPGCAFSEAGWAEQRGTAQQECGNQHPHLMVPQGAPGFCPATA